VTPVLDEHRSYKPIAALAAEENSHGVTIALGTEEYRDVGAFTFYLDHRLPILKTAADVASFLRAPEPRAVLARVETLSSLEPKLAEVPHAQLLAGNPGTLSRAYALLENRAAQIATRRIQFRSEGTMVVATRVARPSGAATSPAKRKTRRQMAARRS
jgi:hypothetical protein